MNFGNIYGLLKSQVRQYARQATGHVIMAREGLEKAKKTMNSGEYDIIVFDEINTAHFFNLITTEEMLGIIKSKPDHVEVIFTGRYAPQAVIDAADLVTEMLEIKHYYVNNVPARDGIER